MTHPKFMDMRFKARESHASEKPGPSQMKRLSKDWATSAGTLANTPIR